MKWFPVLFASCIFFIVGLAGIEKPLKLFYTSPALRTDEGVRHFAERSDLQLVSLFREGACLQIDLVVQRKNWL
jgi:hypothetical protein